MIKSLRIRLKPTKTQELQLIKSANIARFVYNYTLNMQIEKAPRTLVTLVMS